MLNGKEKTARMTTAIKAFILVLLLAGVSVGGVFFYSPAWGKANSDGVSYKIKGNKITVYWGEKPTGGYSISITSQKRNGNTLNVYYKLKKPAAGAMVSQAITHPQATAKIPAGKQTVKKVVLKNAAAAAVKSKLTVVGSRENLLKLLEKNAQAQTRYYDKMNLTLPAMPAGSIAAPTAQLDQARSSNSQKSAADSDYSTTNVQVEGVDEADVV
ncbi:MAG: protease complex subunit PrcB family protein, partial [Chitinophagales bacterium]